MSERKVLSKSTTARGRQTSHSTSSRPSPHEERHTMLTPDLSYSQILPARLRPQRAQEAARAKAGGAQDTDGSAVGPLLLVVPVVRRGDLLGSEVLRAQVIPGRGV